jgi:lysophospholipase L1-like esterase
MHAGSKKSASAALALFRLVSSIVLLPFLLRQGRTIQRNMRRLKPARPPFDGIVSGTGPAIRIIAIGESSVSGVGVVTGEDTLTAAAARRLAQQTNRRVAWRAIGLYGATVRDGFERLLPLLQHPADLLIVAFGVNDAKTVVPLRLLRMTLAYSSRLRASA